MDRLQGQITALHQEIKENEEAGRFLEVQEQTSEVRRLSLQHKRCKREYQGLFSHIRRLEYWKDYVQKLKKEPAQRNLTEFI